MKNGILLLACLAVFAPEIIAQESTASPRKRRTHFEVIAGPNYIKFGPTINRPSPDISPSMKYHFGIAAVRQLKGSSLQAALQYLPFSSTGHDGDWFHDRFEFSNHVVAASLMSKLPVTKDGGITIDLGLMYGVIVSQWDNYVGPYVRAADFCGASSFPVHGHSVLSLQAGTSVKISSRFTFSMLYAYGSVLSSNEDDFTLRYYMLQGSIGYRI